MAADGHLKTVVFTCVPRREMFWKRKKKDKPPVPHRKDLNAMAAKAFAAVRAGTRERLMECKCGHTRDVWDAG